MLLLNLTILVPRAAERIFSLPLRCLWSLTVAAFLRFASLIAITAIFLIARRRFPQRVRCTRVELLVGTRRLMLALTIDALFSHWTFDQCLFHLT